MDLRSATTGPCSGENVQESTFARFSEQLDFRLLQQYLPKPEVSILLLGEPAPSVSTERCLFARERVRAYVSRRGVEEKAAYRAGTDSGHDP